MAQEIALLPYSSSFPSLILSSGYCTKFCLFSPYLFRFRPGSVISSCLPKMCWYVDWLIELGVNVSAWCSLMGWGPIQGHSCQVFRVFPHHCYCIVHCCCIDFVPQQWFNMDVQLLVNVIQRDKSFLMHLVCFLYLHCTVFYINFLVGKLWN